LVELLGRLQLATPAQVRAVHRHAARLAKDLTLFDSVWVDALVQARTLTPFQAARINAGQGESLRVGPYVLLSPLKMPTYAQGFLAREIETHRVSRLIVWPESSGSSGTAASIERLIERTRMLKGSPYFVLPERCGTQQGPLWVNSPAFAGQTVAHWLTRGGRIPPSVVLEIARQMVAGLAVAEACGVVHGDMSTQQVVLDPLGTVQLLDPGLRPCLRPSESDTSGLPAEACNSLAPEQVRDLACSSVATDIYSCGALWWQLLAGRCPLAGATAQARYEAVDATRAEDIGHIAPETPRPLVEVIMRCLDHVVAQRPTCFAELLDTLGPPSDRGQALLAHFVGRGVSPPERLVRRIRTMRRSPHLPTWTAATAGVALALVIGSWPLWMRTLVDEPLPQVTAVSAAPATGPTMPRAEAPPRTVARAERNDAHVSDPANTTTPAARQSSAGAAQITDTAVVQATALAPAARREREFVSREFVLSAARPLAWSQIRPAPGQIVHSRPGERAQIVVPRGSTFSIENVRFEDVDFLMPDSGQATAAALLVTARQVSFARCSFRTSPTRDGPREAIAWSVPGDAGPIARCALRQCVLAGFDIGIRCQIPGEATLAFSEVLFLGPGALVNIDQAQEASSLEVLLDRCTVRGANGVVELQTIDQRVPKTAVKVTATEGVFALNGAGAVLSLLGNSRPQETLRLLSWRGEGCVVAPRTAIVRWFPGDGSARIVSDARLPIDGLVRTELGFAGNAAAGPEASRLVRWQVPLRSGRPPGIGDDNVLFLPAWPD